MEKRKIDVTIAGTEMTIVTDEKQEVVDKLVSTLDEAITELMSHSKTCSKLDAAILVALDIANEKFKAEKRARNLEAQIQLYDTNLRRTKEENTRLKSAMLSAKEPDAEETDAETDVDDEPVKVEEAAPAEEKDEKAEQLGFDASEDAEDDGAAAPAPAEAGSKADKLSQIEKLLRGKGI